MEKQGLLSSFGWRAFLLCSILFMAGLPAAAQKVPIKEPIVFRMFLFQGLREEGQPGARETEFYTVASRTETAGIKSQIKGTENAITASIIEALFDAYQLPAVDQIFFHEAAWDQKKPSEDMITGTETAYQVRLEGRLEAVHRYAVKTRIKKYKVSSAKVPYKEVVLFEREIVMDLDEPVLAVFPNPEGDLFLIIWASVGTPGERKLPPEPEKIYFVTPPKALNQVRPSFPEELRRRNLGGRIGLQIHIDEKGTVSRVNVEEPLHAYLNYSAVQAFRQWTFEPVLIKGKPVKAIFRLEYDFDPRLYEDENSQAAEPTGAAVSSPQVELASIINLVSAYCEKLAEILSGYICEETIKETHYDLMNSRRWSALGLIPKHISLEDRKDKETKAKMDPINRGNIADSFNNLEEDDRYLSIRSKNLVIKYFQFVDPQRDKRQSYLCDYQIFRKAGVVEEHRRILKENRKKPTDPEKTLRDRRYSALGSFFAPLRVLAKDRQGKFVYMLAGEEKISGKKTRILTITPKSGDQDGILAAQIWLDPDNGQILRCEIEGIPLDGQEDILNECAALNIPVQFLTSHEYKSEKDGILYPWRSEVLAAYPSIDPRGPSPRLKIAMAYDKYKFFSVATEHEIIR